MVDLNGIISGATRFTNNPRGLLLAQNAVDVIEASGYLKDASFDTNPLRQDLIERLKETKLPLFSIEELKEKVVRITGKPDQIEFTDRIVGIVEYRDGTVIDVIRHVKD